MFVGTDFEEKERGSERQKRALLTFLLLRTTSQTSQKSNTTEISCISQGECVDGYLRPYSRESTASRLICEVKHVLARIVVRWGTTREVRVL